MIRLTYKQLGEPKAPGPLTVGGKRFNIYEDVFSEWKALGFVGTMAFEEISPMNESPQWFAISINTGHLR